MWDALLPLPKESGAGVSCGHECGWWDASARASGPKARNRASHLYPVFSLMPYCLHSALNDRRRPNASATNSSRIDMTSGTLHGTATSWLPESALNLTHQPGLFLTYQPGPYPFSVHRSASVTPVSPVLKSFC